MRGYPSVTFGFLQHRCKVVASERGDSRKRFIQKDIDGTEERKCRLTSV